MRNLKMFFNVLMAVTILATSSLMASGTQEDTQASMEENIAAGKLPYDGVTITLLVGNDVSNNYLQNDIDLAKEKLGLTVELDPSMTASNRDNIIRTRLASGDLSDMVGYSTGALFMNLNPEQYFLDLSNENFVNRFDDLFTPSVTVNNKVFGIPYRPTRGCGILYNRKIYKELGLSIPRTWTEFLHNCKVIQDSNQLAIIGTYADVWPAQIPFLGDNYNLLKKEPDFSERLVSGEVKYAETPAAVASFQKLIDIIPYLNKDYLETTYSDGCELIATGKGAHWFMLSQAIPNIATLYPDNLEDIGIFGIPGDDPNDQGLTISLPNAIYANKFTKHPEAVKAFLDLMCSKEGLDAYYKDAIPSGPLCIKGYTLPESTCTAVRIDMQKYFDEGKTMVMMQFLTPIKGVNCPSICQECGSGQTSAKEAAHEYDVDCRKQAIQMGLNWK